MTSHSDDEVPTSNDTAAPASTPEPRDITPDGDLPHVVIVGGGFAGISAARSLRRAEVRVTLVDRNPYSTFQPLIYQVATSTLSPGDVTYFLRAMRTNQPNLGVVLGDIIAMDHAAKTLFFEDGNRMRYDYLIVATGVSANFFGIPGAAEHSLPLYTRRNALDVRDRLMGLLDAASRRSDAKIRIVVVGGGPTGVETAGALAEMRNKDLPVLFPEIGSDAIEITLVDMADRLLGPFHPKSSDYARKALDKRGVKLLFSQAVKEVRNDGVVLAPVDGSGPETFLDAAIVLWASGVGVPDIVAKWGLPQTKRGRILVNEHLEVDGVADVFAAGDVASIGEQGLPQLAQPAKQTGKHIGKVIRAQLEGRKRPRPFKYKDLGIMATIGRASAVAEVKHVPRMRGFLGWMIWNSVHIATLMSGRNRLSSFVNLTTKYLLWRKNHSLIVGDITDFSKAAADHAGRNDRLSVARSIN
ncbi:MAG: NAD(P)/FAD-dependent oxidoreductase [Actinomycetaceae bacterium]|nr:NAD(P)/FAD-dependent oxidoreductase [Actinomycetaceae bacterium]